MHLFHEKEYIYEFKFKFNFVSVQNTTTVKYI